jgi:imelysin
MRTPLLALAAVAALVAAGCGGDDSEPAQPEQPAAAATDLRPVKDYLLDHTSRLQGDTAKLASRADAYYRLVKSAGFDYAALLADHRDQVAQMVDQMQDTYIAANPAYEEMEGVVAGVPSLADYDVIIDAGGDKSDPENAVPFSIKTPAGKTFEQPGNFFQLVETSLWGTEPKFAAEGVKPDLDGDGKVAFGEAVPDADFLVAAAHDFASNAKDLAAAAGEWQPTEQDAFTALVVMTPTMSEYFEAWKNSRFVAGGQSDEKVFVAASRLQDIAGILNGLVLIYNSVEPSVSQASLQQAKQTGSDLKGLHQFAVKLREQEAGGRRFSAGEADTLGSDAQDRAEAIAGQVSQAAGRLGIKLES